MAEGGGLLNRYTLSRRIEGSNPSVSAIDCMSGPRTWNGEDSEFEQVLRTSEVVAGRRQHAPPALGQQQKSRTDRGL